MKNKTNRRATPSRQIAIEIASRGLAMVIVERADGRRPRVRGYHLTWALSATSVYTPEGVREMAAALGRLVTREKLSGSTVRLVLSSDLCVTRVTAGTSEQVRAELHNLHDRSAHYLWLGAGPKALAESTRAIDAKHVRTWLTVTNESSLQNIVLAVQQTGLKVELVEHSMVAACRALGSVGAESDSTAIIVELNQRGVDLGVCYKGQLLFDYRPGGIDSKERLGEIIARHLDRIQRYCDRQFRFARGRIARVYLCGEPEEVERVRHQFDGVERLTAETLDLPAVCPNWDYSDDFSADARYIAPLGAVLAAENQLEKPVDERGIPDLMDHFRRSWRQPLLPTLARLAWPVAAALLLAVGIFASSFYEQGQAHAMENQAATREVEQTRLLELKRQLEETVAKSKHLESIRGQIVNPPWHETISMIGYCLPKGTWLDSIRIDDNGQIAITGTSAAEDQVFEFVRYLKEVPVLSRVNLESQRPTRAATGNAVSFDVKCNFSDRSDVVKRASSND